MITFLTPNIRTPGVRPLCGHAHPTSGRTCIKPLHHRQNHSYKRPPSVVANAAAPKQKRYPSKITKLDCLAMIEDPLYRARLLRDLRARKLRPAVECMLWYYAKGKPKELVEHSGTLSLQEELSSLSAEELHQRALDVAKMLVH